ncbi:hypothetical protein JXB11_03610 [Candidatus Woesearchaeota archaeon]|nr:hypothetical protein [Candidatus Woesearchaeota archaeon]
MKKAFEFLTNWVEISFILLLLFGFFISAAINSTPLSYVVVFLAGLLSGKVIYHKKKDYLFPHIILITGFILGYLIGNKVGNAILIFIIFLAGNISSYYAHEKGLS